jgi:mono/diheme cytochrome c family protein
MVVGLEEAWARACGMSTGFTAATTAQLFSSIAEGRAHGMPSWQPLLTADQIWKLTTYIKALRTANEPQAPSNE